MDNFSLLLQSFLVYGGLALAMYMLATFYSKKGKYVYVIMALLLYALVFGFRYGVGRDYFHYLSDFEDFIDYGHQTGWVEWEVGFSLLVKALAKLHSVNILFGFTAFVPLFLLTYNFKKWPQIYPLLFLVFIISCSWLSQANVIRQYMSIGLWALSIKYAIDRKIYLHYFLLIIAATIHNASLLLFVFYPLMAWKNEWFSNIKLQISALLALNLFVRVPFVMMLIGYLDNVIAYLGYMHYTELGNNSILFSSETSIGFGYLISLFSSVILISQSNKVKQYFDDMYINMLYNLYYIGLILHVLFAQSNIFGRVTYFFGCFTFIIYAFTIYYLKSVGKKTMYYLLILLMFVMFIGIITKGDQNTAYFVFDGQTEFYNSKMKFDD